MRLEGSRLFVFGFGREKVVVVGVDGIADGFAPAVRVEGVDVFVLGDVDGLQESLGQIGDGSGGFGFYIAADYGGDEACQGGAEIAGGEVVRMGRRSYLRPRYWRCFRACRGGQHGGDSGARNG